MADVAPARLSPSPVRAANALVIRVTGTDKRRIPDPKIRGIASRSTARVAIAGTQKQGKLSRNRITCVVQALVRDARLSVKRFLFNARQQSGEPTPGGRPRTVITVRRAGARFQGVKRNMPARIVIKMYCQCNLLQIICTLRTGCCLTYLLHRRDQESEEYAEDRNHHQQLHQRKTTSRTPIE